MEHPFGQVPKRWRGQGVFKPSDYLAQNPIFRFEEFARAHAAAGRARASSATVLRHHVQTGRLLNVRRGVYARVEGGHDPWVLGTKLLPDAVVAYDGALSFHGLTGLGHSLTVVSAHRLPRFAFNEVVYRAAPFPPGLEGGEGEGVEEVASGGQAVRVTTVERTLVDLLDRPELGPGPRRLWDCFLRAWPLDARVLVAHVASLDSAVAAARLAFFLQQLVPPEDPSLARLERLCPSSPTYFDRRRRGAERQLHLRRWNLVVPRRLALAMERDPRRRAVTSAAAALPR